MSDDLDIDIGDGDSPSEQQCITNMSLLICKWRWFVVFLNNNYIIVKYTIVQLYNKKVITH